MSCDSFEWTCERCGKTYSNPFFTSYPREFWKDNKKRVGEVLGLCQNPAKNKRGELAAADVERARRALRTYVFGAGASERTGNSLRTEEGEGDGGR